MSKYDYDLITLGAGSGGVRASRLAGAYGAKVAVVEELREGGTCVLRGCVPKKLLVYGSHVAEEIADAAGYGWAIGNVTHNWETLINAKNLELDRLHDIYVSLLENVGVERFHGRGVLIDKHTVAIGTKNITAERILIAVGGWPSMPTIPGIEHTISSNEALDLRSLPRRIVIVGSGYIAVEFAGIFNGFGSHVDLIFRADKVLRGFDEDMRLAMTDEMKKKGINIISQCLPSSIDPLDGAYRINLSNKTKIEADQVMYATGRAPNTKGLGLEEIGVKMSENGAIMVDERNRSSVDSIFAVGDVTDRKNLTPVAIAEARAFSETFYNNNPMTMDYNDIPCAVFSQPPIASVGFTEQEAKKQIGEVDIYVSGFRPMKYTMTHNTERGFQKLIVDRKTQRVVGAHMMGVDAPEIIQGIGIALKKNATKADFDATIGIHPTAAEEFVTMRQIRAD
ncbi:MAG: glutathione-disulfide reductase [Rhodospirillaceae bacterium]|nr:glutathione-disulfide reductase [Rhodospirillaceae bacterium]|tara:strand:+ start:2048 stop:3403 length:1356 start_codon:yes stop_codon:yes gene_type:complete